MQFKIINGWAIVTFVLLALLILTNAVVIWRLRAKIDATTHVQPASLATNIPSGQSTLLTQSPSGNYRVTLLPGSTGTNGGFVITDQSGHKQFELQEPLDPTAELNAKNFVWNNDESAVAITYVPMVAFPPLYLHEATRSAYLLTVPMQKEENGIMQDQLPVVNRVNNLGSGAYYGNNQEKVFYPVVSPDGKYVAIQTDLIHAISIYDFLGNKVVDLKTKYADIPLFSPQMYEIEGGKYSPFLDYRWNDRGDGVMYKLSTLDQYQEVRLPNP